MKNACAVAAAGRMHRAARLTGAAKQQEYFAAQLHDKPLAVRVLLRSRDIYRSVRDHPASAAMRRKGQLGLDTIGRTLERR